MTLRLAVFASGSGTNLQALIDRFNQHDAAPASVALVVSDRPDAGALERARLAAVPTRVLPVAGRDPDVVAAETLAALDEEAIDAIALAGYLRLIPAQVVSKYRGRMVNIHPALLPAFGGKGMYGLRVHRAVLEASCMVSGATVHYVHERYDEGRALAQWPVPVLRGDTPETLAARVLRVEHMIYPIAIEVLARDLRSGGSDVTGPGFDRPPAGACFAWCAGETVEEQDLRDTFGLD